MRLPERLPPAQRAPAFGAAPERAFRDVIKPQGCSFLEAALCAGDIFVCKQSGLDVFTCLGSIAPHCIKCAFNVP